VLSSPQSKETEIVEQPEERRTSRKRPSDRDMERTSREQRERELRDHREREMREREAREKDSIREKEVSAQRMRRESISAVTKSIVGGKTYTSACTW